MSSNFYTLPPFTSKPPDYPGLWLVALPVDPNEYQKVHAVRVNNKLNVYAMNRWIPQTERDHTDPSTGERIAKDFRSILFLVSGVDDPAKWDHQAVTYLPVQMQTPEPAIVEDPNAGSEDAEVSEN